MKKRTKGTSFFVTLIVLALSIQISYGAEANFNDLKGNEWYYNNVKTLVEDTKSIIIGYPDGTFRPLAKLTKDQFITMVVRAAGFEPGVASDYWAQNYINKAIELNLIEEDDFDNYRSEITREEMSMIVVRVVEYLEGDKTFTDLTQVKQVVNDSQEFTYKYENYIMKTYKLGIITGCPDHTFKPQGVLTRSEASAVVVRLIDANERIVFDYDALYNSMYGSFTSHLLGGANWVNPITASDLGNATEDWELMTSDMLYLPSKTQFEVEDVTLQSDDYASALLYYDENGPHAGHIEDVERLLQRRMPQSEVDVVMDYLETKTDKFSYLEHDEVFFYLDNDRYIVRVDEVLVFEGTEYESAGAINFNIWYRDSKFINEYEESLTRIRPYTDTVIYR
jgi:hypothetical protein